MKERVIYSDSRCVNTFVNLIQIAYICILYIKII